MGYNLCMMGNLQKGLISRTSVPSGGAPCTEQIQVISRTDFYMLLEFQPSTHSEDPAWATAPARRPTLKMAPPLEHTVPFEAAFLHRRTLFAL